MGMLAAVEMWKKRDHDAEWAQWEGWLKHIANRVTKVNGVTAEIKPPAEKLSNHSPTLLIQWDAAKLGITGQEVSKTLLDSEPRIVLGGARGSRPDMMQSSISITPYMMIPGDEKVAADRIFAVLSKPPKFENPPVPSGQPVNVAGQWNVHMEFSRGSADHVVVLEQKNADLVGTHHGEVLVGDLRGNVAGNEVHFRSGQRYEGTFLGYDFTGKVIQDRMEGTVQLGEYGEARWTAQRHAYAQGRRRG